MALIGAAALAVGAAPAGADTRIGPAVWTEVAAHGAWIAWLENGHVVVRDPAGDHRQVALGPGVTATSIALGTDRRGRLLAVGSGCSSGGCDLYRIPVRRGDPTVLREASALGFDETQPAVWRGTLVFTRRVRDCSSLIVRRLGSRATSRRIRRICGAEVRDVAVRGDRVAVSEVRRTGPSTTRDQAVTVSLRTDATRVWRRVLSGTSGAGIGQVALDARHLYLVRPASGTCMDACGLERIDLRRGRRSRALAPDRRTTFAMARLGDGRIVYQPVSVATWDFGPLPAALVRSDADPFARRSHALVPELSMTARSASPWWAADGTVLVEGRLTRTIVRSGLVVRIEGVEGATVQVAAAVWRRAPDGLWCTDPWGAVGAARTDRAGFWAVRFVRAEPYVSVSADVTGGAEALESRNRTPATCG